MLRLQFVTSALALSIGCTDDGIVRDPSGAPLNAAGFVVGESEESVKYKLPGNTLWEPLGDGKTTTTQRAWKDRDWEVRLVVHNGSLRSVRAVSDKHDAAIDNVRQWASALCSEYAPDGEFYAAWAAPNFRRYTVPFAQSVEHGTTVGCFIDNGARFVDVGVASDIIYLRVSEPRDQTGPDPRASVVSRSVPFDWRTAPHVGDSFTLGSYRYRVDAVTLSEHVGENSFLQRRASADATFVRVNYSIENVGNETAAVVAGDLMIRDSKGRLFRPSSEATTALALEQHVDILMSELQPGIPRNQVAAFEVPNAAFARIDLVVPEKGSLGSGEVVIPLRFQVE